MTPPTWTIRVQVELVLQALDFDAALWAARERLDLLANQETKSTVRVVGVSADVTSAPDEPTP